MYIYIYILQHKAQEKYQLKENKNAKQYLFEVFFCQPFSDALFVAAYQIPIVTIYSSVQLEIEFFLTKINL